MVITLWFTSSKMSTNVRENNISNLHFYLEFKNVFELLLLMEWA